MIQIQILARRAPLLLAAAAAPLAFPLSQMGYGTLHDFAGDHSNAIERIQREAHRLFRLVLRVERRLDAYKAQPQPEQQNSTNEPERPRPPEPSAAAKPPLILIPAPPPVVLHEETTPNLRL